MMKRTIILLMLTAIFSQSFTQNPENAAAEADNQMVISESGDKLSLELGKNLLSVRDQDSSFNIRVGNRGLSILESLEGSGRIVYEKYDKFEDCQLRDDDHERRDRYRRAGSFRGHWSGIEAGFNNYNYLRSMSLPDNISYMRLNTSSSFCFNLNISQLSIGLTGHSGLVTGVGINWNNYRFIGMNSITQGPAHIEELVPDRPSPLKRSKFSTLYLNVPVLFEVQIPAGYSNRLNLAAGVIGGLKLNAWTKMVFEDDEKFRANGDYNLNLLRGGATARVGYGNFMIYGTCYLTPWFRDQKGPGGYNPEPFEIGIAFTVND